MDAIESVPDLLGEVLEDRAADRSRRPNGSARPEAPFTSVATSIFRSRSKGALKLKEISYIHAEGYPTAEMKHGPIALVDGETPVRLRGAARLAARQDAQQSRGGQGTQRHDHHRRHRGGRRVAQRCPMSSCRSPTRPRSCSRCWPSCRCSCWPITSRVSAAAISTSRAIWPRA